MNKAIIAIFFVVLSPSVLAAQPEYRTVALSGQHAAGLDAGLTFSAFRKPVIGNTGDVAFYGDLAGSGVSSLNFTGVWADKSDGLKLVARKGDPTPGFAGVFEINNTGESVTVNDAGRVAFISLRQIWSESGSSGTLNLVAALDQFAPGQNPSTKFTQLYGLTFNKNGDAAFIARTNHEEGIWQYSSVLSDVVTRGEWPVGAPSQAGYYYFSSLTLNNSGKVVFGADVYLSQPSGSPTHDGIWTGNSPNSIALVAKESGDVPGLPGLTFGHVFPGIGTNDAGETVFTAHVFGAGVGNNNHDGIWVSRPGNSALRIAARGGDFAPGTPNGVYLFALSSNPLIDAGGRVAFISELSGPGVNGSNNTGIWKERSVGDLVLVAREGQLAPGTNVMFKDFLGKLTTLNEAGQIAFLHTLSGTGITSANDAGIWATDFEGNLNLIAREGSLFDVNSDPFVDDLRTIATLSLVTGSGGQDGRARSFNDLGELVFQASFTDGSSGVFVAVVPEPSTVSLFVLGGVGLLWRSRRRNKSC